MSAKLVSVDGTKVKIEVVVELSNSMLTAEENIQKSLNPAGLMATEAALLKGLGGHWLRIQRGISLELN